jgi:hypothetical protein
MPEITVQNFFPSGGRAVILPLLAFIILDSIRLEEDLYSAWEILRSKRANKQLWPFKR